MFKLFKQIDQCVLYRNVSFRFHSTEDAKMESLTVVALAAILFSFTTTATILFSVESSMSFEIKTSWDNQSLDHQPAKFTLSCEQNDDNLTVHFKAPFFNDPPAPPNGVKGKPFPQLWEYEGLKNINIYFVEYQTLCSFYHIM